MLGRAFAFSLSLAALPPGDAAAQLSSPSVQPSVQFPGPDRPVIFDPQREDRPAAESTRTPATQEIAQGRATSGELSDIARMLDVDLRLTGEVRTVDVEAPPSAAASLDEVAERHGIPPALRAGITVLPVTINGEQVLRVQIPTGYGSMVTVKSVGPNAIEVSDPRLGGGNTGPGARRRDGSAQGACGVSGLPCFESTAVLHSFGSVSCSGVVIAPGWLLTAAHCACGRKARSASLGVDVANPVMTTSLLEVYGFGETPGNADGAFCGPVDAWLNLPGNATGPQTLEAVTAVAAARDLALVRLSTPLAYLSATAQTAIIAPDLAPRIRSVFVSGFGSSNAQVNGGRKTAFAAPFDPSDCARLDDISPCLPDREFALLDNLRLADSCTGDSGAGAFVVADGAPAVLGIVSRSASQVLCGAGGVYAQVADATVIDWIQAVAPAVKVIASADLINPDHLK